MPTKYEDVAAAVAFTYKGIDIYHVYKNDDIDERVRNYYFTTEKYGCPDMGGDPAFDVRDLPTYSAASGSCVKQIERAIHNAIDQGILTQEGLSCDQ